MGFSRHTPHQSAVGERLAALNSLIPRAGGAQQTWEGSLAPPPALTPGAETEHFSPPAPGIQVCPLWGAATVHIVHLNSPKED